MGTFETQLPEGYTQAAYICGVEADFWDDLKSTVPGLLLVVAGCGLVKIKLWQTAASLALAAACVYPYFVLHELIHGSVYRLLTGQKVKIGFSKSGAWCSLPDIYVYRNAAACCTAAPFAVLAAVLGLGYLAAVVMEHWLFLPLGLLMTLHLLACRSDVNLLKEIGKYKDSRTLVLDSGTEQRIYRK